MVKLIIEGGSPNLAIDGRRAFNKLLCNAGFEGKMPQIIIAGGRGKAYDCYKNQLKNNVKAVLLVDSELPIDSKFKDKPWDFLKKNENWDWLEKLDNKTCHLMVQCMETWFLADKENLQKYFGNGFSIKFFQKKSIEKINKRELLIQLNAATNKCKTKKNYDKGRDSFKILMCTSPQKISHASYWAKRFFTDLGQIMNNS